jgi:hypothetical protein
MPVIRVFSAYPAKALPEWVTTICTNSTFFAHKIPNQTTSERGYPLVDIPEWIVV